MMRTSYIWHYFPVGKQHITSHPPIHPSTHAPTWSTFTPPGPTPSSYLFQIAVGLALQHLEQGQSLKRSDRMEQGSHKKYDAPGDLI